LRAALGNGLEFFDFTVDVTYLGMIGQAFFPSDNADGSEEVCGVSAAAGRGGSEVFGRQNLRSMALPLR
jgi:hypothetical protein